jgi:hypothetical protein
MKKMRLIAGLTVACVMTGLADGSLSFTAAELYTSNPLDTQNSWSAEPGWIVDTTGSGSAATTIINQRAVYGGEPIVLTGTDNAIRIRTDFSYSGTLATPSGNNTLIGAFGLSSVALSSWTEPDINTTYLEATQTGIVRLKNDTNIATLSPTASLVLADLVGDDLAIEYTVVLGSDAASSTFQAKLINVTDAAESDLGSYTGLDQNVFDAATTTGLHPTMWCGLFSDNGTGITGVTVESISWETIEVLAGTTVDFVNPPYVNGELDAQVFWSAQADMLVNTNATTVRTTTAWRRAISGGNALFTAGGGEGDSATIKADFYFEDVLASENKIRANFGFTSDYANSQKFYLRTSPGGDLELRNDTNTDPVLGSIPIPGSNDALRITYTLLLGADAASSTMQAVLLNTVNGDEATASYTGIAGDIYTAATATNGALRFRYQNGEQNLPLVLDQVNFSEAEGEPPAFDFFYETDFTAAEGYVDGPLGDNLWQQGWTGQAGPTVDSTGSGFVNSTNAFRRNLYTAGLQGSKAGSGDDGTGPGFNAGDEITITMKMAFTLDANANRSLNATGMRQNFSTGGFDAAPVLGFKTHYGPFSAETGGSLKVFTDLSRLPTDGANNPFALIMPGLDVGVDIVNSNDFVSDDLLFEYTVEYAGADTWTPTELIVSNLTTATLLKQATVDNPDALESTTLAANDLYLASRWTDSAAETHTDSLKIVFTAIPVQSTFDLFVATYGLTGVKTADEDLDTLNDYGEYVFGGDPTNANDIGTQPSFDVASGDYTFALVGDDTVVAHVVTTEDLAVGSWNTNATVNVTATDGVLSNYIENVSTAPDELFIKLLVE